MNNATANKLDAPALLQRSAMFWSNPDDALLAIEQFIKRWPNSQEARDVRIANECLLVHLRQTQIMTNKSDLYIRSTTSEHVTALASFCTKALPIQLSNGLITSARVNDELKRQNCMSLLKFMQDLPAIAILQPLFDKAAKESQSLLVNGKPRAQVSSSGLTYEEAVRDAQVYDDALDAGDLDTALKGFTYLKQVNQESAGIRYFLGKTLQKQGETIEQLQEFLYGWYLNPRHEVLTADLMLLLCRFSLYPTALEVLRHYTNVGGDTQVLKPAGLVILARSVTAAYCLAVT